MDPSHDARDAMLDAAARPQIGVLTVPGGEVVSVALSQDGKTMATASDDGTVRLWDVATQQQTGSTISVPGGGVGAVALSKNGETLATYGGDGTERRWDVAYLTDTASDLCTSAGRSLTRAEWAQYDPGVAYRSICS